MTSDTLAPLSPSQRREAMVRLRFHYATIQNSLLEARWLAEALDLPNQQMTIDDFEAHWPDFISEAAKKDSERKSG